MNKLLQISIGIIRCCQAVPDENSLEIGINHEHWFSKSVAEHGIGRFLTDTP